MRGGTDATWVRIWMSAFGQNAASRRRPGISRKAAPEKAMQALNIPGIHRIVVSETAATVAFDDLTFNTLAEATVPMVPTLSDYALLGLMLLIALIAAMPRLRRSGNFEENDRA
jgi:hypothetical protein